MAATSAEKVKVEDQLCFRYVPLLQLVPHCNYYFDVMLSYVTCQGCHFGFVRRRPDGASLLVFFPVGELTFATAVVDTLAPTASKEFVVVVRFICSTITAPVSERGRGQGGELTNRSESLTKKFRKALRVSIATIQHVFQHLMARFSFFK